MVITIGNAHFRACQFYLFNHHQLFTPPACSKNFQAEFTDTYNLARLDLKNCRGGVPPCFNFL